MRVPAINQRRGMTAVEVVASTLLASMLMTALIGVLQGLKAQEKALDVRMPTPSWQTTLDKVLQRDLANSRTYSATPTALILNGFAGQDAGTPNWQPTTIVYEIAEDGERNWLIRHEGESHELVLAGVSSIRTGFIVEGEPLPLEVTTLQDTPITGGLVVQFWGQENAKDKTTEEPRYGYRFRRP